MRAVREGKTSSINGKDIPMRADCICVHSDTPGALVLAKAVHDTLAPFLDANAPRAAVANGCA